MQAVRTNGDLPEARKTAWPEGFWNRRVERDKTGRVGGKANPGRRKKAKERKPMNFQQSLDWAGRLGRRLKTLERKDIPR